MSLTLLVAAALASASQPARVGDDVLRYPDQNADRLSIRTCRLKVESVTSSAALPAGIGPKETGTQASPPGATLDPSVWAADFQKAHGTARAVLRAVDACPQVAVLVYATNASSLDPVAIAEAGTAIPLGCIPEDRHADAIRRFEAHPGPKGRMVLVALGRRAKEGTFRHVGRYDWDRVREQARATQFTMKCSSVHPDPDNPARRPTPPPSR